MRLELSADEYAPAAVRRGMETERGRLGSCFDDVALILSELVSNSVRHAGAHEIEVVVDFEGPRVHVAVTDAGTGFERVAAAENGGLGLVIVDELASDWGVERGDGTTVWASVDRDRCHASG
jgi:anti-sigma regulatory factor (Ser/Thr protein kinase)